MSKVAIYCRLSEEDKDSPEEDIKSMKKWLAEVKAIFDKVDFEKENLYMTYTYVCNSEEKDN